MRNHVLIILFVSAFASMNSQSRIRKKAVTRRYVCQFNSKLHTEPKRLNTMEVSQSRNLVQSMMTNLGEVKMKGPMTSNGKSRSALNSK